MAAYGWTFCARWVWPVKPFWLNFFDNPGAVQFNHRLFAYFLAALIFSLWLITRKRTHAPVRKRGNALFLAMCCQVFLGVLALLHGPQFWPLALLHQGGGIVLFLTSLSLLHAMQGKGWGFCFLTIKKTAHASFKHEFNVDMRIGHDSTQPDLSPDIHCGHIAFEALSMWDQASHVLVFQTTIPVSGGANRIRRSSSLIMEVSWSAFLIQRSRRWLSPALPQARRVAKSGTATAPWEPGRPILGAVR